jgi:hypothetical protein
MQRAQIRPVSLEHRGTIEQLNETFDDPNDPKRFFKIPREKECTLQFFTPVPVTAATDILVRLVGSRGTPGNIQPLLFQCISAVFPPQNLHYREPGFFPDPCVPSAQVVARHFNFTCGPCPFIISYHFEYLSPSR